MRACCFLAFAAVLIWLSSSLGCGGAKVANMEITTAKEMREAEAPQQPAGGQGKRAGALPVARKIIYTGDIEVIVEDFGKAAAAIEKLVRDNKGYLAHSDISNSPGAPRSGTWRARVPVDRFDAFRDAVAGLGEVQKNVTDSQDVTDEFYDLQARIKNKQKEEARLNDILQKATGKLEDVLKVEEVLSRVRGEIEQLQGQAQRLANLTALTTITITLHERRSYVPPEAPGLGTTLGRTFSGSVDALASLGRGLLVLVVALAPWLPVAALIALPCWLLLRRQRRKIAVAHMVPAPAARPES
jgi:hypothetical protein